MATEAPLSESLWSERHFELAEFSQRVNEALECESFKPPYINQEQVVILPMSQMLGRLFAAALLASCDAARLQSAPEPKGHWMAAKRLALRLPSREVLQAHGVAAWRSALETPVCDFFWRTIGETEAALLPSPLVQLLELSQTPCPPAAHPRMTRNLLDMPTTRPMSVGDELPDSHFTQGAYDVLRLCPYRFFATRPLGLKQVEELEPEVDKRDFGVWSHAVLHHFHQALAGQGAVTPVQRLALLELSSVPITESMGLPKDEFLPFSVSWSAVAASYLGWLQTRRDGQWWVLDYKSKAAPQLDADLCAQLLGYRAAIAQAITGQLIRAAFLTPQGALIEINTP